MCSSEIEIKQENPETNFDVENPYEKNYGRRNFTMMEEYYNLNKP